MISTSALECLFLASLGTLVYTYIGYPILLSLCQFGVRRESSNPDESHEPSVSIVLAAPQ